MSKYAFSPSERRAVYRAIDERRDMRRQIHGLVDDEHGASARGTRRRVPRAQDDLASVSCAIQNLWLAARAEGLGMGWVSLFDPRRLADLLGMPDEGLTS